MYFDKSFHNSIIIDINVVYDFFILLPIINKRNNLQFAERIMFIFKYRKIIYSIIEYKYFCNS